MKVIHPYAESEAKYDFWFLSKALDYVKDFKQKNFGDNHNLYLDHLYSNLKNSVNKVPPLISIGTRPIISIKNFTLSQIKTIVNRKWTKGQSWWTQTTSCLHPSHLLSVYQKTTPSPRVLWRISLVQCRRALQGKLQQEKHRIWYHWYLECTHRKKSNLPRKLLTLRTLSQKKQTHWRRTLPTLPSQYRARLISFRLLCSTLCFSLERFDLRQKNKP